MYSLSIMRSKSTVSVIKKKLADRKSVQSNTVQRIHKLNPKQEVNAVGNEHDTINHGITGRTVCRCSLFVLQTASTVLTVVVLKKERLQRKELRIYLHSLTQTLQ